ncbi:uncharacterized protein BO97DRAFT_419339 [Aspergillus homomorphus CBS 101889]|uniref:Cytochrome P450 n=1 Tax=Aspergillus homomorphus (strain CBS 101889) TaxID=1450537 RepID=A0A395HFW5_ASPHC|nr:hypothetical protein BO97DRAFT_419339 [Aspergillus homomorphus CBS 101889]RAL06526.1 hypothetical protein BO97DRAFT_419339 [Aspergillus homomorphus CBS 101889]
MSGTSHIVLGIVIGLGLLGLGQYLNGPLKSVPGPIWSKFTKLWLLRRIYSRKLHLLEIEAHEKYGPIFRAAPNYVMVNDPDYIHEVHTWNRSDWWITLDPQVGLQSTGTARTITQHNQQRRRIASAVRSPFSLDT